jgi:hypothetical protein
VNGQEFFCFYLCKKREAGEFGGLWRGLGKWIGVVEIMTDGLDATLP